MKHTRSKKKTCDVKGCDEPKKKSVPVGKAEKKADLDVEAEGSTAYLCKKHWKEFKKATKEDRELDQIGWD